MIKIASVHIDEQAISDVSDVLRSGNLVCGDMVKQFEHDFAEHTGARHAIAVSSGTAALHIAYLTMLAPGDEVIVPALSHVSTASMVVAVGGIPVFCDVNPDTLVMDPKDAENKITRDTAALAPVHLYGGACDIDSILGLADEYSLVVIWDACQAHGTRYHGRDVGTTPHMVCYSFYATKTLGIGEGGMITTDDLATAEMCRLLRSHGQARKYYHAELGYNYRMTEVQAVLGISQLSKLSDNIERRRSNAQYFDHMLKEMSGIRLPIEESGTYHSYHQYTIQCENRDAVRAKFIDVETAIHYPTPLHEQPIFDDWSELPVAEKACQEVLSIPIHQDLTQEELETIVKCLKS